MNYCQSYIRKSINQSEDSESTIIYQETEEITDGDGLTSTATNSIAVIVACIFVIGLVNNAVALIVIASSKSMHTATNCYLFSLSMSDILLLITGTTQEMYNLYHPSQISFGIAGCAFKNWAAEMSLNVSILTIAAFTIERYLAICYPFYAKARSQLSRAVKILVAAQQKKNFFLLCAWLLAALCALAPALKTRIYYEKFNDCYLDEYFLPYYLEVSSMIFFVVPMVLMTIMYAQIGVRLKRSSDWKGESCESRSANSRNTLKMFVIIVATFFVCWMPFHAQRLMTSHIILYVEDPETLGSSFGLIMDILKHGSIISYLLSAVMDPIIYSIMSVKFRQAFKDLLSKRSNNVGNIYSSKTNNTRISLYSNRK